MMQSKRRAINLAGLVAIEKMASIDVPHIASMRLVRRKPARKSKKGARRRHALRVWRAIAPRMKQPTGPRGPKKKRPTRKHTAKHPKKFLTAWMCEEYPNEHRGSIIRPVNTQWRFTVGLRQRVRRRVHEDFRLFLHTHYKVHLSNAYLPRHAEQLNRNAKFFWSGSFGRMVSVLKFKLNLTFERAKRGSISERLTREKVSTIWGSWESTKIRHGVYQDLVGFQRDYYGYLDRVKADLASLWGKRSYH